eukprot:CAMPEP_0174350714 /NCGR_PEP_ID=MMETSP0811_2-20130205/7852_1 /TAXON_ID=73025 ORGANISM="Eutreptiella gymnastica-like, Strain CCMP1594" /NCGR_SAMPLE_ID=MMETSP0811_2 /ASSEMBLY_ACC=CAM_ASM_000667 /LENGTH=124 /DNA_ID=CAMNT_0015479265 /DNA_START=438 /DNA_END=812 /DNA_ORIENTATION=+
MINTNFLLQLQAAQGDPDCGRDLSGPGADGPASRRQGCEGSPKRFSSPWSGRRTVSWLRTGVGMMAWATRVLSCTIQHSGPMLIVVFKDANGADEEGRGRPGTNQPPGGVVVSGKSLHPEPKKK